MMNLYSTKFRVFRIALFACVLSFTIVSCSKESAGDAAAVSSDQQSSSATLSDPRNSKWKAAATKMLSKNLSIVKTDEYSKHLSARVTQRANANAVEPSECAPTELDAVVDSYLDEFGPFEFALFGEYAAINQLSTFLDDSKQYFGANGEYTHLVRKHQRKLESFWNMPGEIRINGEHNSTLDDRDKIAEVYMVFAGVPEQLAYQIADEIIAINRESPVFIETPLLSFDGFATVSNLIVLGDGLIQGLSETGVESDIVVGGVLSHEWAHQVQFNNSADWYGVPAGAWPFTPEFTRQTELEADFFSSYYLTHKRGATYNWKRVSEFFELFFNIGDCAFTNQGHHGTPQQRLSASRLGYVIANETQPKGHILTADQLHAIFMENLDRIISNSIAIP